MDYPREISDIEDLLFPQFLLSVWERTLYYHLLRHTRVIGQEYTLFGLDSLAKRTGMSVHKVRKSIRSLHQKRCIVIDERSRQGHSVRVLLPSEIALAPLGESEPIIDIKSIDFFTGRNYVEALATREQGKCFYCLRAITVESCVLDHVKPQLDGDDNSFRNVVAVCHECNSRKGGNGADSFLRILYREGLFTQVEFSEQAARIVALQKGQLIPDITC